MSHYQLRELVSDIGLYGQYLDMQLKNPTALVLDKKLDVLYVAQNKAGVVSRYSPQGVCLDVPLKIPFYSPSTIGSPRGLVLNPNPRAFLIPDGSKTIDPNQPMVDISIPATLICVTDDGLICAWNATNND